MSPSIHGRGSPEGIEKPGPSDAEALAHYIGALPERYIVLLENHNMTVPVELLDDAPRQRLQEHNIHRYYHESSIDSELATIANLRELGGKEVSNHQYGIIEMQQERNLQKIADIKTKDLNGFTVRPIGSSLISHDEAVSAFEKKHGTKTLVRGLLLRPALSKLGKKASSGHAFCMILDDILTFMESGYQEQRVLFACFTDPANQNLIHLLKRRGATDFSLRTQLVTEWQDLSGELIHARRYGKSDALSAANCFSSLEKDERAIFVYGMGHGLGINNPACFPAQLQQQSLAAGHTDVSMKIILLTSPEHAAIGHEEVSNFAGQKQLREDVVVYDYELRKEWPVREWHANAAAIYRQVTPSPPNFDRLKL